MASSAPTHHDTIVTLKVNFQGGTRRFKLPLRDLGPNSLEDKVRHVISYRQTVGLAFTASLYPLTIYRDIAKACRDIWLEQDTSPPPRPH